MREVKFRAWDKDMKEMLKVDRITFNESCDELGEGILDEHNDWHSFKYIELMQFTGLKDKNGKEIFEGDVVKIGKHIFVVEWSNEGTTFNLNHNWVIEVIGNIYENPELLEKGEDLK